MFSTVRTATGRICVALAICAGPALVLLLSAGAASAATPQCTLAVEGAQPASGCGGGGALPPAVTVQPADATGYEDGAVQYTAAATAAIAPTVSWEYSFDNGTNWNAAGQFTDTYTLGSLSLGENDDLVRAAFTNLNGTTYTRAAHLTVLAAQPVVTPDSQAISFGYQQLGTTSDSHTLTVTNTGTRPLAFADNQINTTRFVLFGDTCSRQAVVPGGSCTMSVAFAPDVAGPISGVLVLNDNAPGSAQIIGLDGTGTQAPGLGPDASVGGVRGEPFDYPLPVTGSPAPSITAVAGALPPGLNLGAGNVISGTPTAAGIYHATFEAANGAGTPADQTLTFDIAPRDRLTLSPASVTEGNAGTTAMTFTYRLTRPATVPVSFHYATRSGTAISRADFRSTSGTVNLPAGSQVGTIQVLVKGDTQVEPDEQFTIVLSHTVGLKLVTRNATGTIVNDD